MRGEKNLLWLGDKIHAPLKPSATEGEYTTLIPKFSTDPMAFRVRCPGHVPVTTAPVACNEKNVALEVSLVEHASQDITVQQADGSPAAKTDIYIAWGNNRTLWTGTKMQSNPHLVTDFIMNFRHLEFHGKTGEDGHCLLPPCADEASVLVADDSGYVVSDYGRLAKESTLKLQPYSLGDQELVKLVPSLLPVTHSYRPRLYVRLMRDGKPVLGKDHFFVLYSSDRSGLYASFLPVALEQGVASLQ